MTLQRRPYTGFQQSRFDWSLECAKIAERDIYKTVMKAIKIQRFEGQRDFVDKDLGVDVVVTADSGRQYALAERFRGGNSQHYQQITIRCESLYNIGKKLEVNKSIARYMLYGYVNTTLKNKPTRVIQWALVNLQDVLDLYRINRLPYQLKENKDDSSTFIAINFDDLRAYNLIREERHIETFQSQRSE